MMVKAGFDWWFADGGAPQLLTTLAVLAGGNAIEHARSLLEQHETELTALREASPRSGT
jgi:hypothetical protein